MISFFKRKQPVSYQLHALQSVRNRIEYKLRLLANYLSSKTSHLSSKKLALLVISFCVLMAICLSFIGFTSVQYKSVVLVQSIRAPILKQSKSIRGDSALLIRVMLFHSYLDSLKHNDTMQFQNIINRRPHLLDSVIAAEQFLQQENY